MPHISNKKISDESFLDIYNQLIVIFHTASQKRMLDMIFKEFLTPTEKVMLTKRLAIIYMISEGISIHYISEILLVSRSTVSRISLAHEIGKYRSIETIIKKNKESIWQSIENMISDSTKSYIGKGRWKRFNEIQEKYNKNLS